MPRKTSWRRGSRRKKSRRASGRRRESRFRATTLPAAHAELAGDIAELHLQAQQVQQALEEVGDQMLQVYGNDALSSQEKLEQVLLLSTQLKLLSERHNSLFQRFMSLTRALNVSQTNAASLEELEL